MSQEENEKKCFVIQTSDLLAQIQTTQDQAQKMCDEHNEFIRLHGYKAFCLKYMPDIPYNSDEEDEGDEEDGDEEEQKKLDEEFRQIQEREEYRRQYGFKAFHLKYYPNDPYESEEENNDEENNDEDDQEFNQVGEKKPIYYPLQNALFGGWPVMLPPFMTIKQTQNEKSDELPQDVGEK